MSLDFLWIVLGDVIYNAQSPFAAPDIIFGAEDEGFEPLSVYCEGEGEAWSKSSLSNWNSRDPSKLLSLIHELRDIYKSYQRTRVGELDDDRLKFEISTIVSREEIEVCVVTGPERFTKFQVVFPVSRKYSVPSAPRIKLVSSPDLKTLFSVDDVKLPQWLDGMCMAEYLPILEDNLKVQDSAFKIVEAIASVGARRRFIEALAPIFGRPLEADQVPGHGGFDYREELQHQLLMYNVGCHDGMYESSPCSRNADQQWDVIYNAQSPFAAPDIIFGAEDEGFEPLSVYCEGEGEAWSKSSLSNWNSRDPSKLLSLIHELRDIYKSYQRTRVGELDDDRLKFEISTIVSREEIEVCVVTGPERFTKFQVVFPVSRKYSVPSAPRIKLVSSPDLKTLFSVDDVKLPQWLDGMCMAEYLPILEDNLKVQIVEAIASVGARRRFIEALAPIFGRPLEADQHFTQGVPIMSPPVSDYPWSPRWEPSQMVERIL
ncbi:hypothetical protein QJS04_geneDACA009582 [Acorus gramineus]|uniref:BRISC and BRCA1-A complex member 2 n=1 Tax=Acorus gramineus TaxID=55184 RepID=A0AAV9BB88_ACOGR|nr:hypothetical protein QJS04_geneDACA009582 [Acorus gramineus]